MKLDHFLKFFTFSFFNVYQYIRIIINNNKDTIRWSAKLPLL